MQMSLCPMARCCTAGGHVRRRLEHTQYKRGGTRRIKPLLVNSSNTPQGAGTEGTGSGVGPGAADQPAHAALPVNPSPAGADADDGFARAWTPPPGEPPLWFVEKFEARRKEEARKKAEDPTYVTTLEQVTQDKGGNGGGNPALGFLKGMLQAVQLLVVLSLLLLFPAFMHDGGLSSVARPWTTFAFYLAFFGLGTIARMVKYGSLVPRSADKQVASWAGRLSFLAFVMVVPLLHWAAMYRYVGLSLYTAALPAGTTLYDLVGGLGMAAATALNVAASRELGPAYDRVAAPPALVTTGPYRFVQHPIYVSYMLLFVSYGMWLHSAPAAIALLVVCGLYYRVRTSLEEQVLEGVFGSYYRDYAARTKRFVPFVV